MMNKISSISVGLAAVALPIINAYDDGYNAYIYYTNAKCSDSSTISGTFIMAYDNSMFEGLGLEYDDYDGECLYFKNGYIDLLNDDVYSSFVGGYCVECSGVVGCSPSQSCDDLLTGMPQNVQLYQMSMGDASSDPESAVSSNKYQLSTLTDADIQVMDMENAEASALMRLEYGSIKDSSPFTMFAAVGTLVTLVAITALVASVRRWNSKRARTQSDVSVSFVEL